MLKNIMWEIDCSLNEYADNEYDMRSYLNDIRDYEFVTDRYGEFSGVRVWFAIGDPSIYLDTTTNSILGAGGLSFMLIEITDSVSDTVNQIFKEIYKNEIQNKS